MTMFMLLPALVLTAQSGVAAQVPPGEEVLQVGVFSYRADGMASGSAYGTAESKPSTVYVSESLCQLGAGFRELPAMAAHAWRFSGKVISTTDDIAVVQLEWQRIMEHGTALSGAPTSVQLTLKAGEPEVLDSVAPAGARTCPVASAVFEARYVPRNGPMTAMAWRRGGGTGQGAGAGAAAGGAGGGVTGRGVRRTASDADALNVDLWLVHSAPGRDDETTYQTIRASREGAIFAFAPSSIQTPAGPISVQVTGSFATANEPRGPRLIFMTQRRVSFGPVRGASSDEQGTSRVSNPMPGPDDVLSFELPAIEAFKGRPAVPDQFAVRVRIRPAGPGE